VPPILLTHAIGPFYLFLYRKQQIIRTAQPGNQGQQFTSLPMLKSCCLAGQVSNPFQQQIVPDPTGISYQKLGKIKTKSSTDVTKVFMENTDIKRAFKKIDNNNHRKFTSKHRRR
jgi:hypothetical protein